MTNTGWLDRDEMEAWLSVLSIVDRLPAAIDAQLRRDHGITRFEYYVLAMLSGSSGGRRPMTELAEMTNGSLSRLSHAVSKLEERSLLTRAPDPCNGRVTTVEISASGQGLLDRAAPSHVAEVRRVLLDVLPEGGAAHLADLLRPVAQRNLAADGEELPWERELTSRMRSDRSPSPV